MIERYSLEPMKSLWSLQAKYERWLQVELAACEAWAQLGRIPPKALKEIKARAGFDVKRIQEIEATVRHDVIAFLENLAEHVGASARYIHMGLTSSDVLDTALALQMRQALGWIIQELQALREVLKEQALRHRDTLCMGRSHGVHAEPMVFGLKFALWYEEAGRHLERLRRCRRTVSVGKLSGAVGTYSHVPPRVEELTLKRLGLRVEPVATQVVQRDRHAEYLMSLALLGATLEKIAVELRHLQRTEVLEAEEPFAPGQKGSSAMPHKRNPVGAENISGLARVLRANALAALENVALWHERDISHSSVERIIIPDSSILAHYMLRRLRAILQGLRLYPQRMKKNMALSHRLYCSQRVLLALTHKGLSRQEAYRLVQRNAMLCWQKGMDFLQALRKDKEVRRYLSPQELQELFSLRPYLQNIGHIYQRVFGGEQ